MEHRRTDGASLVSGNAWVRLRANNRNRRLFCHEYRRHCFPHDLFLSNVAPLAIGIKKLFAKRDDHIGRTNTGTLDVGIVTFVNGADNIGIYAPLFAVSEARRLIVLVAVLHVLLAVWCVAGYLIHRQKAVAYTLRRWGHRIVPVVLIALGIYILSN